MQRSARKSGWRIAPKSTRREKRCPTPRWSGLRPAALVGCLARTASGPKPLSSERWTAEDYVLGIITIAIPVVTIAFGILAWRYRFAPLSLIPVAVLEVLSGLWLLILSPYGALAAIPYLLAGALLSVGVTMLLDRKRHRAVGISLVLVSAVPAIAVAFVVAIASMGIQ